MLFSESMCTTCDMVSRGAVMTLRVLMLAAPNMGPGSVDCGEVLWIDAG